jgi:hypothetical protein
MFDVIMLSVAGVIQLAVTWYTVDISMRENRVRNAIIIAVLGLAAVGLTSRAGYDAYVSDKKRDADIAKIKEQLSDAKVGLVDIKIQPDAQTLAPDKDFTLGLAFEVSDGAAKNLRCFRRRIYFAGPLE